VLEDGNDIVVVNSNPQLVPPPDLPGRGRALYVAPGTGQFSLAGDHRGHGPGHRPWK
jgi:hypothetical protein